MNEREVGSCDCVLEIKMSVCVREREVGVCDCTKVNVHACALLYRLPRDMCVLVDQKSP